MYREQIQDIVYNVRTVVDNRVLHSRFLLNNYFIASLNSGEKMSNYEMINMLIYFTIVAILLYTYVIKSYCVP
jgi:hypothetical protein